MSAFDEHPLSEDDPGALSRAGLALAVAIPVAVFALTNPIWEQHDIRAWDQNILWSYLVIPALVALILRREKKLNWASFGLEVMKVTFIKFVVTYAMATAIWEFRGAPGTGREEQVVATDSGQAAYEVYDVPELESTWPAGDIGAMSTLDCTVTDSEGSPIAGALVYVTRGLESFTFRSPTTALDLRNSGQGFQPRIGVAQTHQVVSLATEGTQLHTAVFSRTNRRLLNFPVIPNGSREVMFDRAHGLLTLSCSVHGAEEPEGTVLVLDHPYWAFTDKSGRVSVDELPPGELTFAAYSDGHSTADRTVQFAAGGSREITLKLAPQE